MGKDALLHLGLVEGRDDGPARHVDHEGRVLPEHGRVLGPFVVELVHGVGEFLALGGVEGDVALRNPLLGVSGHAKQRIAQRNISLNTTQRQELADAMDQLDDKGAQDAAVLREDAAFVVNVPSRTVVTALDQTEMKQRVFTQIDSAMRL